MSHLRSAEGTEIVIGDRRARAARQTKGGHKYQAVVAFNYYREPGYIYRQMRAP